MLICVPKDHRTFVSLRAQSQLCTVSCRPRWYNNICTCTSGNVIGLRRDTDERERRWLIFSCPGFRERETRFCVVRRRLKSLFAQRNWSATENENLPDQTPTFDTANEQPHGSHESLACTAPIVMAALALVWACEFELRRMHVACPPSMAFPATRWSIQADERVAISKPRHVSSLSC
jgi:hypothetical protein